MPKHTGRHADATAVQDGLFPVPVRARRAPAHRACARTAAFVDEAAARRARRRGRRAEFAAARSAGLTLRHAVRLRRAMSSHPPHNHPRSP